MLHYMRLNSEPFSKISNGYKTIELRLNDEKRQGIKVGDEIIFSDNSNPQDTLKVTVVNLHYFPTFNELYKALPLDKCGYTADETEFASPKDMEKYYTIEKQMQYGVLGIEIKL